MGGVAIGSGWLDGEIGTTDADAEADTVCEGIVRSIANGSDKQQASIWQCKGPLRWEKKDEYNNAVREVEPNLDGENDGAGSDRLQMPDRSVPAASFEARKAALAGIR
jgi:hypothetical protein